MNKDRLKQLGPILYAGKGWEERMAADPVIYTSKRTVQRWASGDSPIPPSVGHYLEEKYTGPDIQPGVAIPTPRYLADKISANFIKNGRLTMNMAIFNSIYDNVFGKAMDSELRGVVAEMVMQELKKARAADLAKSPK